MNGTMVSAYPAAASVNPTDALYLVHNSLDYKVLLSVLFGTINTPVVTSERLALGGISQSINNSGTITSTQTTTVLTNDVASSLTINNGVYAGQIKILLFSSGSNDSTISGANLFSDIVFNTPGQSKILFWQGLYWWQL